MAGDERIVAIDGPAGTGKSTVARQAARRLGFHFLDTGAMYRAATVAAQDAGVAMDPLDSEAAVRALLEAGLQLDENGAVLLSGRIAGERIRTAEVTRRVSAVSAVARVREILTEQQREFARRARPGIVVEGRDMCTVVFPRARYRVYLDASPEVRAKRRLDELKAAGLPVPNLEQMTAEIRARDEADSQRAVAPLRVGIGAQVIDTSNLSVAQVVERIVSLVERERGA